jgi:multiple sugar transport system permease protein
MGGSAMSGAEQVLGLGTGRRAASVWLPPWKFAGPRGSDVNWAIAFLVPYIGILVAFALYPICFGFLLGSQAEGYADLFDNPQFWLTVFNTFLLVGVGVNVMLFLAFLLSGFFILPGRWIKALLVLFMLPWALPALPAFLSMHWMFIGYGGFLNSALETIFGIEGPIWFNSYELAIMLNVLAYIWKWMPFWTLVFLAGRLAIPQDIYDAAAVDGASGMSRFTFVTFPMLSNLYLVSTLLATLWAVADFVTAYFVSSGAPALETEVLATFSFRMMFDYGYVELGLAAGLIVLPLTIPLTILLIRRMQTAEMQL